MTFSSSTVLQVYWAWMCSRFFKMLFNVSSLFSTGVALCTFAVRMVSVSWVPPYYIYRERSFYSFFWMQFFFEAVFFSERSFFWIQFLWIQFLWIQIFLQLFFSIAARYVFRSYMSLAASVVMGAGSALRRCLYAIHGCFLNPKRLFLNPRRFFANPKGCFLTPEGCFATQEAVSQIKMVDLQTSNGCYANPFITRSAICSGVMLLRHA